MRGGINFIMMKKIASLLALCSIFFLSEMGCAEDVLYKFPKNEDTYFANFSGSFSEFFHFKKNRTYIKIDRDHLGIAEIDSGTWLQNRNGLLVMSSSKRFRDVIYGSLTIFINDKREVVALPAVKELMSSFLNNNQAAIFSGQEVQNIYKRNTKGDRLPTLYGGNSYGDDCRRQDIEGLIRAIDAYPKGKHNQMFFIKPLLYKERVVLIWNENESLVHSDIAFIKEQMDALKNSEIPFSVFTLIDKETYERETSRPEPFKFYTEMNKKIHDLQKPAEK
jgi:hypothetical protein